jgi:hypothetical protein
VLKSDVETGSDTLLQPCDSILIVSFLLARHP